MWRREGLDRCVGFSFSLLELHLTLNQRFQIHGLDPCKVLTSLKSALRIYLALSSICVSCNYSFKSSHEGGMFFWLIFGFLYSNRLEFRPSLQPGLIVRILISPDALFFFFFALSLFILRLQQLSHGKEPHSSSCSLPRAWGSMIRLPGYFLCSVNLLASWIWGGSLGFSWAWRDRASCGTVHLLSLLWLVASLGLLLSFAPSPFFPSSVPYHHLFFTFLRC